MADLTTSVRLPTLGLSLVATGACAWWLHRTRAKKGRSGGSQTALHWRQVPPAGAAQAEVKHFGETNLQAQLEVERLPPAVMQERAQAFLDLMSVRRTMRFYSSDEPPGSHRGLHRNSRDEPKWSSPPALVLRYRSQP